MSEIVTKDCWDNCTDPSEMLKLVAKRVSDRKLRLFVAACCHRIWNLLGEADHRAIEMAESYADGLVGNKERRAIAKSTGMHPVAQFSTSVSMGEDTPPHLGGSVAAVAAEYAAKQVARQLLPSNISPDGSITHYRAVERLARSKPYMKAKNAEQLQQAHILRDILGNPFSPLPSLHPNILAWNAGAVTTMAKTIYDERRFDRMQGLADELEKAGCTNSEILGHCRQPFDHVRGCWVVDVILGKH